MPERPLEPTLLNGLNDMLSRLRAVERQQVRLPASTDPLQGFENGTPLGDIRFMDFGRGIHAVMTNDDFAQITVDSGDGGWDAIVDANLSQSVPSERLFMGIGEALTYLFSTVGLTNRAFVLVRPGTYIESANWTNANSVFLFGLQNSPGISTVVTEWRHNDFSGTTNAQYRIDNMGLRFGSVKTRGFAGASANLEAHNCFIDFNGTSNSLQLVEGYAVLYNCIFQSIRQLGATVWGVGNDCRLIPADGSNPQTIASTALHLWSQTLDGDTSGTARTWTCPSWTEIQFVNGPQRVTTSSGGTAVTLAASSPNSFTAENLGTSFSIHAAISGTPKHVSLRGGFRTVSVTAPDTVANDGEPHRIDIGLGGAADITGPANINIAATRNATITIRGEGVVGQIDHRSLTIASGTWLDFVNADRSVIQAAVTGAPSGTAKPYALDAASTRNFLIIEGFDLFPATGTDAGTNNIQLPEDFGPSGAPVTVAGHVIEDEGVAVTQRANMDFVGIGVSVADAGGKTVVTIAGGSGEPGRSWMGI